jgi:molecular chaperone GrpE
MAGKSNNRNKGPGDEVSAGIPDTDGEDTSPEEIIKQKEAEISELKEQLLRQRAEFDNFRKRSRREAEDFRKFAAEGIMFELLEVYDNFERALASCRKTDNLDDVIAGVEMVFRQFVSILEKEGLKKIECEGREFDPAFHEATSHVETTEYPDNTVMEVCLPGYELHSKVIRPAVVTVSKNVSQDKADK